MKKAREVLEEANKSFIAYRCSSDLINLFAQAPVILHSFRHVFSSVTEKPQELMQIGSSMKVFSIFAEFSIVNDRCKYVEKS